MSIHCVISASTDARGSKNHFFSLSFSLSLFLLPLFFFHNGYFARASDLPSVTLDLIIFRIKYRSSLLLATKLMAEVPLTWKSIFGKTSHDEGEEGRNSDGN